MWCCIIAEALRLALIPSRPLSPFNIHKISSSRAEFKYDHGQSTVPDVVVGRGSASRHSRCRSRFLPEKLTPSLRSLHPVHQFPDLRDGTSSRATPATVVRDAHQPDADCTRYSPGWRMRRFLPRSAPIPSTGGVVAPFRRQRTGFGCQRKRTRTTSARKITRHRRLWYCRVRR